jgi:hypothetical protein
MNTKDTYSPFWTGENLGLDQVREAFYTPPVSRPKKRRRIPERTIRAEAAAINAEWTQIMCDRWKARQDATERELEQAERELEQAERELERAEYRQPPTAEDIARWYGEW